DVLASARELEQLRQRVIATHHLGPMLPNEVQPYIEHRLKIVGWAGNPRFEPDAIARLAEESGGVPRPLNTLVQNALERAALQQCDVIDLALVEAICVERREAVLSIPAVQPVAVEPSPQKPSIRSEVHELKAAIASGTVPANCDVADDGSDRMAQIEKRLSRIEARLSEQDEMFATILSKMIEWIDDDEAVGPKAHRAA
ncbi:MAG: general secretion pathway protein, partial [Sphingobium sp.]|nr:general secretion pathway protein [Sphingobium sp.]